jgi:hypothetical protein
MNTNQFRQLKLVDLIGQILIVLLALVYWFIDQEASLLLAYGIMGGWQLLSCIVHIVSKKGMISTLRKVYVYTLILLVATFLIGLLVPIVLVYYFYFLLFLAPCMGIYYLIMSLIEYRSIKAINVQE